jgi:hypothetical protein
MMSNPRTSIEDLKLTGSGNLKRALKREAQDASLPALTTDERSEVQKIDQLIALAMRACRRGQTFRGKANPAFRHLSVLVKTRDLLTRGRKPTEKRSTTEISREIDRMLQVVNSAN